MPSSDLICFTTFLRAPSRHTSSFIAGLGMGPLVVAPLSEFYGRRPVYNIGFFFFFAFSWLVAFGNFAGVLVGRFIQGLAGSAFLSVAGGTGKLRAQQALRMCCLAVSHAAIPSEVGTP